MAEMPTFFSSMSHLPPLVAAAAQRTDAAAARMTRISWLHIVLEIDLQEIVVCMIRFFCFDNSVFGSIFDCKW